MEESVTIPKGELDRLRERTRRLALEKSYLQLVNDLMNALNQVPGLDNTVEAILRLLLDNIGGTNVSLHYLINEQMHYSDVYGQNRVLEIVADPMVREAMLSGKFVEEERPYDETRMTTPEFTVASAWAFPLMVRDQVIGVLKMEGMLMAAAEVRKELNPFFNYAALVLKNEIENYARLAEINSLLQLTNASLMESQEALRHSNEQLEARVSERTAELKQANEQLQIQLGERRRAEAALQIKTEELDHFLNIAPDLLCIANTAGFFLRLNLAWEKTLGYTIEELTGIRFYELIHPDDVGATMEAMANLESQQAVVDFVNRYRRKDGVYRWIEWRSVPAGKLIYAAARDITDRIQGEQALRRSEEKYRTLFEESFDGLFITSQDGRILDMNKKGVAMFGYSTKEEMQALRLATDVYAFPEDRPRILAMVESGRPAEYDVVVKKKSGEHMATHCSLTPVRDQGGTILSYRGIIRDISEQKAAEDELHRYRAQLEDLVAERTTALESANRELEAFSYSVSHDLRTPLRAIDGFSRMLESKYANQLDDEAHRYVTVVRANAQKMARLIDDMLSFSRSGRSEMRRSRIDMEQLVQSVWSELEGERAGRDVSLKLSPLPQADGDPSMLRQVWINLIGNAIKFTSPVKSAVIEVSGNRAEETNSYMIKDNGVGFDETYAEKLFGVFQRLHGVDEFPGTGIGLAIVKRIVTRHGGQVSASGKVGEGATISFVLPVLPTR